MITYTQVTDLSEVSFDNLFLSSYPLIDKNFIWPPFVTTFEQKKQHYLKQLEQAAEGTWPLSNLEEHVLMYVVDIDGQQVEFTCGYIEPDRCFRPHWFLTAPEANDSRNWLYTAANRNAKAAFYEEHNILSYKVSTYVGSDIYKLFKMREATGNFRILTEEPTVTGPNVLNLVTLRIAT